MSLTFKHECVRCGGEFTTHWPMSRFCSKQCETEHPADDHRGQRGWRGGYAAAVADICAGLRTKRTAGGETITGAVHAAEVIERGDFNGFADKQPVEEGGAK